MLEERTKEGIQSWIKTGALVLVAFVVAIALVRVSFFNQASTSVQSNAGSDATGWLFTMVALLISGVYVFTTFRIDRSTKAEARETARELAREEMPKIVQEAAKEYLQETADSLKKDADKALQDARGALGSDLADFKKDVESAASKLRGEATDAISQVKAVAGHAKGEIRDSVEEILPDAKAQVEKRLERAAEQIEKSLNDDLDDRLRSTLHEQALRTYGSLSFRERLFPTRPEAEKAGQKDRGS